MFHVRADSTLLAPLQQQQRHQEHASKTPLSSSSSSTSRTRTKGTDIDTILLVDPATQRPDVVLNETVGMVVVDSTLLLRRDHLATAIASLEQYKGKFLLVLPSNAAGAADAWMRLQLQALDASISVLRVASLQAAVACAEALARQAKSTTSRRGTKRRRTFDASVPLVTAPQLPPTDTDQCIVDAFLSIPSVGKTTAARLVQTWGSLAAVAKASKDDLLAAGIKQNVANQIVQFFHST